MLENWYAVYVKRGNEEDIQKRLAFLFGDELKAYNPKRELIERKMGKVKKVEKVLFPGYIFLHGIIDTHHILEMRNIKKLHSFLKEDIETAIIPEDEIKVFKHLIIEDVICISDSYIENDSFVVHSGPLVILKRRIVRVDKRKFRAKVAIELLGEKRFVDLGINIIMKN